MTKSEVDECRHDALKLVLLAVINQLGEKHGRLAVAGSILKSMGKVRETLFREFRSMADLTQSEKDFTWDCLNNYLSIFENIMQFKEGPYVLDLLRIGLGAQMRDDGSCVDLRELRSMVPVVGVDREFVG